MHATVSGLMQPEFPGTGLSAAELETAARLRPAVEANATALITLRAGTRYTTLEAELFGHRERGSPAIYEAGSCVAVSPPERGGFVLERVECNGVDLTGFLTDDMLAELEREANS